MGWAVVVRGRLVGGGVDWWRSMFFCDFVNIIPVHLLVFLVDFEETERPVSVTFLIAGNEEKFLKIYFLTVCR